MKVARKLILTGVAFSTLLAGCSGHKPAESDLLNLQAALPPGLPVPALQWKVISSSVDRQRGTMTTLTGNEIAVASARSGAASYPDGSVLALITWAQREDPHWFGARIPAQFESIETVSIARNPDGKTSSTYRKFVGNVLKQLPDADNTTETAHILSQRASVMP